MEVNELIDNVIAKYNWRTLSSKTGEEIKRKFEIDYKLTKKEADKLYRKLMTLFCENKIDLIDKWTMQELRDLSRLCQTNQSNLYIAMQLGTHTPNQVKIKRQLFNSQQPSELTSLEKECIQKYSQADYSIRMIANKLGRSQNDVKKFLGIKVIKSEVRRSEWKEHNQIIEYIKQGLTAKQIAKALDKNQGTLRVYLRDFNLKPVKEVEKVSKEFLEQIRIRREDQFKTFYAIAQELGKTPSNIRNLYTYHFKKKLTYS